jgi:hypothetical protein
MRRAWRWAAVFGISLVLAAPASAQEEPPPAPATPEARDGDEVSAHELLEALASIADQQASAAKRRGAADDAARWTTEAERLRDNAKLVATTSLSAREFAERQEQLAEGIRQRAAEAHDDTLHDQALAAIAFWSDLRRQLEAAKGQEGPIAIHVRVPGRAEPAEPQEAPAPPSDEPGASGAAPAGAGPDADRAAGVVRSLDAKARAGDAAAEANLAARLAVLGERMRVIGMSASAQDIFEAARAAGEPAGRDDLRDERLLLAAAYRADAARALAAARAAEQEGGDAAALVESASRAREMAEFLVGR